MKLIIATKPGQVELNFMWLPTWLGMSNQFRADIEDEISPMLVGKDLTEELLDEAHNAVVDLLEKKFPKIKGLRDYLDAIKFVYLEEG